MSNVKRLFEGTEMDELMQELEGIKCTFDELNRMHKIDSELLDQCIRTLIHYTKGDNPKPAIDMLKVVKNKMSEKLGG